MRIERQPISRLTSAILRTLEQITDKIEQECDRFEAITTTSAAQGPAGDAMKQHISSVTLPILRNGIEAAVALSDEAFRVRRAFADIDSAEDAIIDSDEVQATVDRLKRIDADNHILEGKMRGLCAEAAALGCNTTIVNISEMALNMRAYEAYCQNLLERANWLDATLTRTCTELEHKIDHLTRITQSATKPMEGTLKTVALDSKLSAADLDSLAWMAIAGDFGNGEERKAALGDLYDAVQGRVNELWSCDGGPRAGVTVPVERTQVDLDALQQASTVVDAQWCTAPTDLPFHVSSVCSSERLRSDHSDRSLIYSDLDLERNPNPFYFHYEKRIPFRDNLGMLEEAVHNPAARIPLTNAQRELLGSRSTRVDEQGNLFGISYDGSSSRCPVPLGNNAIRESGE